VSGDERRADGARMEAGTGPGDDDEDVRSGGARSEDGGGSTARKQQTCVGDQQRPGGRSSRIAAVSVSYLRRGDSVFAYVCLFVCQQLLLLLLLLITYPKSSRDIFDRN